MKLLPFSLSKNQYPLVPPDAFSNFYEQAHLSVFRYAMVLCGGNQAEAEDITADAFFRAWEKRQQFSGSQEAALGWVITIARNLLIDHRRSENTHPADAFLDDSLPDAGDHIETILVDDEQFQKVFDSIRRLPFPHGDILTLRYVLGWQVKTIAAHLGLAENTVSVNLRRALARIQLELVSQEFNDGRTK